jgi:hypothetical protein
LKRHLAIAAALSLLSTSAFAAEFTVRGVGSAVIKGKDPQTVRAVATRQAKRNAVMAAIDKMLGAGASGMPAVSGKIDAVAQQISDGTIVDSSSQAVGGAFEVSLSLALDDREFRELLSDQGIALNTATARGYSILAVMDEYRTTPKDLRAPLEELEEFSTRKGASFSDRSSSGAGARSANAEASQSSSSLDARGSQSSSASGKYNESAKGKDSFKASGSASSAAGAAASGANGSASLYGSRQGSFSGSGSTSVSAKSSGQFANQQASASSVRANDTASSAASRSSASSSFSKTDVQAETHDDLTYRKLVKYQPQSTAPEQLNRTYGALMGQLEAYDLRMIDNDMFRSRYFQNQPLTLDRMSNSGELSRYVEFAKRDARADFFMAGTSVIIDSGISPTTRQYVCSGLVTVKTFSTVDGELIASDTFPANGSGMNSDDCAGDVARKMALSIGPVLGAKVQNYWKKRSMYGREVVLTLTGSFLSLPIRARFSQAVAGLSGVENSVQRSSSGTEMEFTVSYKGASPIDQALAMSLMNDPVFANLDSRTDGQRVVLCLGPCKPGI